MINRRRRLIANVLHEVGKMIQKIILMLAVVSVVGCQANTVPSFIPNPNFSVYQTVLSHLNTSVESDSKFAGLGFAVAPEFCEPGKNPFMWSSQLKVASDLTDAFERANSEYRPLETSEFALPFVKIREIESFHGLYYYREEIDTVDIKGLVQFWQAGFSETRDIALVRFFYGPSAHGAVGTYVLQASGKGWTVKDSVVDYYL